MYSLDEPITEDGNVTLKDVIPSNSDTDVLDQNAEEVAVSDSLKDTIKEVLLQLSDKQQRVLDLRFGLSDGTPKTLEQVRQELGVTDVAIHQLEKRALETIRRRHDFTRKLRSFLED